MSFVNEQSYERHRKRRMEKLWRRSLAWLLAVCICLGNVNMAAFAAETAGTGMFGATPSNAAKDNATPSNADRTDSEIWLPDDTMTGEELLKEAERAVTYGYRFDFDNLMNLIETGESDDEDDDEEEISRAEQYEKIFKGYESFTLFYDNGKFGRVGGESDKAYAYIVIRVPKETYYSYLNGDQTARIATASEADATEGGYKLTGDEDIVFLYVNASEQDITYYLNLEDVEAGEVTVPNADAIWEEPEKTEKTPASLPAEGSMTNSAGASNPAGTTEAGKNNGGIDPAAPAPDRNEASKGSEENGGTQENGSAQESGSTEETGSTQENGSADLESSQQAEIETGKDTETSADGNEAQESTGAPESTAASESTDAGEKEESSGTSETGESKDSTDASGTNGNETAAGEPETSGNETTGDSETAGSGSSSSDNGKSDENTEAPVESEVTLTGSRHKVFTLMEPYSDDEESETLDDEMTFEEWQAMVGDDEEEEEYDGSEEAVYDEEEGVIYLNLNVLPVTVAEVKKEKPKRNLFAKMFFMAQENTERAAVLAGVTNVNNLVPKISGAHKQIEYLGGDDYRLHLDIAGGNQAVDIVLVIDLSNSMKDNDRLDSLKNTIIGTKQWGKRTGGFVKDVLGTNPKSRFSIVTYGTKGEVKEIGGNTWSNNLTNVVNTIDGLSVAGGTNYEAGLWHAKESLEQRGTTDNIPYVIFLSDGVPTYYNKSSNGAIVFNDDKYGEAGAGNETDDKTELETINAAKKFNEFAAAQNANIYSVAFGFQNESIGSDKLKYLRAVAYGTTDVLPDMSRVMKNGENLSSVFADILKELEFKNVTIVDTLSEYVDLAGNSLASAEVKVEEHKNDGTTAKVPKDDYKLSYDENLKKITLKFNSDKVLSATSVYELSFNIKLTSHAYEEYAANGYGTTVGDENTDYSETITSSGMPGFHSNNEAFVSFGEKGTSKMVYPKPVVQVPYEPEYQKYIKDNGDGTYDLTLNVKSTIESTTSTTTEKIPADIVFVLDESGSMAYSMSGSTSPGYGQSRQELVNKAMRKLIENLGQKGCDVRYAGVHFYGIGKGTTWNPYRGAVEQVLPVSRDNDWPSVINSYRSELDIDNPELGTYPYLGLEKAVELLKTGSSAHKGAEKLKRYVVFLTDGEPTEDDEKENATKSKVQLQKLNELSNVTFFSIGYSNDALTVGGYLDVLEKYMASSTPNITKQFLQASGDNENDTDKVFEAIESDILKTLQESTTGVTGVTITDELSEYADFVTTDPSKAVIAINGTPMTAEEYEKAILSVTITERTAETPPRIVITFNPSYELEKDAVYSVTFGVKPTEKAYQEYANNAAQNPDDPYDGVTGDPETDAPGNHTSSEEPGFHTNAEATLKYTLGSSQGTLEYPHPVLQVSRGKARVVKIVDGLAGDTEDEFLIHLYQDDSAYTSLVLKNGERSPYIPVTKTERFRIDESVPMEYQKAEPFLVVRDAKSGNIAEGRLNGMEVTVNPGDDLLIEVHNQFEHIPYFHAAADVTNYTSGDLEVPFNQDGPVTNSLPEAPVAAAVDPGERRVVIKTLEEDERLA